MVGRSVVRGVGRSGAWPWIWRSTVTVAQAHSYIYRQKDAIGVFCFYTYGSGLKQKLCNKMKKTLVSEWVKLFWGKTSIQRTWFTILDIIHCSVAVEEQFDAWGILDRRDWNKPFFASPALPPLRQFCKMNNFIPINFLRSNNDHVLAGLLPLIKKQFTTFYPKNLIEKILTLLTWEFIADAQRLLGFRISLLVGEIFGKELRPLFCSKNRTQARFFSHFEQTYELFSIKI